MPVTVAAPDVFAAEATALGIGADTVVVAYDDYWNALAGRLVWVLRSYGHPAAHLLDGGLRAWLDAGLPLEPGAVTPPPADPPHPVPDRLDGLLDLAATRAAMADGVPSSTREKRRNTAAKSRTPAGAATFPAPGRCPTGRCSTTGAGSCRPTSCGGCWRPPASRSTAR